jgi:small GTP-binding protein
MAEEYDYLFKSIVVGDGGVGKTALTLRFSKGFFTEDYKMTIGVDFHVKTIVIETAEGPIRCKLQLWDTGGQERFSSVRPMYYRGSLGTVLVFDLTNSASFEHLPLWIEEVRANVKSEIPLLLVGNKSDLIDDRSISMEEINNFTRKFNLYYMETSAKTGDGVGDCFYILACLMIGQGVPEQLIANRTVFGPGQIIIDDSLPVSTNIESRVEYEAPPVPEPTKSEFTPEPEQEYIAPPVPEPVHIIEPEPEIEFEAPPVPEPPQIKPEEPLPSMEVEQPNIEIPEPTDIDFRTPDEILSELPKENSPKTPIFSEAIQTEKENYVPKSAPFTPNVPTPVPAPKEFQDKQSKTSSPTPFRVINPEESPKPKSSSMPFLTPPSEPTQEIQSDSLVDYMPKTIISKKEKKKIEKEKKKLEKEKLKIEKEKKLQAEREMKHAKKSKGDSKKTESPTISQGNTLFQTLTHKTEENSMTEKSESFVPFIGTEKKEDKKSSTLRIIPNVADIEPEPSGFTALTPPQEDTPKAQSKDLLVCEQCGAILSADYAFCNKCGNKLS